MKPSEKDRALALQFVDGRYGTWWTRQGEVSGLETLAAQFAQVRAEEAEAIAKWLVRQQIYPHLEPADYANLIRAGAWRGLR